MSGALKSTRARSAGLWLAVAAAAALLVALAPPAPQAAAVVQSLDRPAVANRPAPAASQAGQASGGLGQVLRVQPRHAMDASTSGGTLWALPPPPPPPPPQPRSLPAVAVAAPPAPAAAPALPFRLLGRYVEGGREGVVLQGPEGEVYLAHAGETLAGNYRVESLSGNMMVLHYLPLDLRQTMDIGITR